MTDLIERLNTETVNDLKKRLTALSCSFSSSLKKAELMHLIESCFQLDQLKIYWTTQLNDLDKQVVAEVVYGPPAHSFDDAQFFAKHQKKPQFYHDAEGRYGSYNKKPTLLGALFFNGYMPSELQIRFKSFIEKPLQNSLKGIDLLPDTLSLTVAHRETVVFGEIKIILKLVLDGKIKISDKTNYPSSATIKLIESHLYDGDFYSEENKKPVAPYEDSIGAIRAFSWMMLLQAGKLAKLSGTTLQLTAAGKKALYQPIEEVIRTLWQDWLKSKFLDEFRRIDNVKGQTGKGKRDFTDPIARRLVIQSALQGAPINSWIKFDSFSRYMLSNRCTFDVVKKAPWNLYICEPQYGSLGYAGSHSWNILQDRYLLCFLFEYAATLGLIDVAYVHPKNAKKDYGHMWGTDDLSFFSRYDGLVYFRINNLGSFCLNANELYQAATSIASKDIAIHVDESGLITISALNIPVDVLVVLEQFCRRQDTHHWILDQDSLIAALETRYDLTVIVKFFSTYQVSIPKKISELIEDIIKKSTQLRMKNKVVLFECAQAELARQFSSIPSVSRYCSWVGEKLLAIPEVDLLKFKASIGKLGYVIHV